MPLDYIYRTKSKLGKAIGSFPNFVGPICFCRRTSFDAGCVLDAPHVGESGDHLSSVAGLRYASSKLKVLEEPTHFWMSKLEEASRTYATRVA
jgi:hypothetical protein